MVDERLFVLWIRASHGPNSLDDDLCFAQILQFETVDETVFRDPYLFHHLPI